uniref:cAMP-dependent protein kinase regulatory subunit n=1 Tax=Albugo laibachii Nc14 TaxID=890382 RepID=F0WAM9_9STRA|nr:cAMPdependent protein kinase regulatory subunit put [Albugo laibachii Nc14]|eukprot:CCA18200.1 cAMPdependent protein kinase regulatory subunit put [Albugo laibachii Nc14]
MSDVDSVQQELQAYLQDKGINTLFISMVESLLLTKPDNPIAHIIEYLQTHFPEKAQSFTVKYPSSARNTDTGDAKELQHANPASASDDESESEEEEEDDDFGEIYKPIATKQLTTKSRRISVSAEALSPHDARKFERVVHNKSLEERNRISKIVAENLLFKSMDEKQHEIVLDAIFPKEFEPEDVIIRQGADGDNFYILESGVCEIYKDGVLCTEAMSFGELALMYNAPRAATVKATQKSKAWALDRQTFKYIIMETTVKRREAHIGFIEKVPLLESLSEYERLTVADALKAETFHDGEVIIRQGDDGNHFYIIEEGTAVCTKQISATEAPSEIGLLTSGAYFGEIALLTMRPRQATVTAKGTVKCLSLDRKTFKRVMGPLEDILKRNLDGYNTVIANNI